MPYEPLQQKQIRPFANGHNIYRAEQARATARVISTRSEELGAYTPGNSFVEEIQSDVSLRVREQGILYPYLALIKDINYDLEEAGLPTTISSADFAEKRTTFVFPRIARAEIGDITPVIFKNYFVNKASLNSIGWSWAVDGSSTINFSFQGSSYIVHKGTKAAPLLEHSVGVSSGVATLAFAPTKILKVVAEAPSSIADEDITDVCSIASGANINVGTYNGVAPTSISVLYTFDQQDGDPALFYGRVVSETVTGDGVSNTVTVSHNGINLISIRDANGALFGTSNSISGTTVTSDAVFAAADYVVTYITDEEMPGMLTQTLKSQARIFLAPSYASKGDRLIGVSSANANANFNTDNRQELGSKDPYLAITQLPADVTCDLTLDETENVEAIYDAIMGNSPSDEYDFLQVDDTRNLYVEILDNNGNVQLVYKFPQLMLNTTDSGAELKTTATRTLNFTASDFYITSSPAADF